MKETPGGRLPSPGLGDVDELRTALAEASETIFRFPSPFIVLDDGWRVVTWNEGAERVYGHTADEMLGRSYLDLVPEPAREEEEARLERILDGRPVPSAFVERIGKNGGVFPVLNEGTGVRVTGGKAIVISDREVSERVAAEQAREELRREIDHRVKNLLATVQGVLDRNLTASAHSVDRFAEASKQRVAALAAAYQALTARGGEEAELRKLLVLTLGVLGLEGRVSLRGGELTIPAAAASPLALAFHELADNAIQHGALTQAEGQVEVRWAIEEDGRLRIVWSEAGGPPVGPRSRVGFGTRLIEEGIPYQLGGETRLELRPEGVECEIRVPLNSRPP